jgi:hypothetical protein
MNKTDESIIEPTPVVEPQEVPAESSEPKVIEPPKRGWFFPNPDEQLPFGGEFATFAEALDANQAYLAAQKKASK